jgi:hypothetical protein
LHRELPVQVGEDRSEFLLKVRGDPQLDHPLLGIMGSHHCHPFIRFHDETEEGYFLRGDLNDQGNGVHYQIKSSHLAAPYLELEI